MHVHPHRHASHWANVPRPEIVPRHQPSYQSATDNPTPAKRSPAPIEARSSSKTCASGNCENSTSSTKTATLPVVLGAVVPIVCAIIVLFFLHRRHVKKLRREDANDKHKSLDFGLDHVPPSKRARGDPMQQAEKPYPAAHTKGISLDIGHPYLFPPGLHSPSDSMSMSVDDDGKYRPANTYLPNDNMSVRSYPHAPHDDAESVAGSTSRLGVADDMNQGLLGNAQRMSRSSPPLYEMPSAEHHAQHPVDNSAAHGGFQLDLPISSSPAFGETQNGHGQTPGISIVGPDGESNSGSGSAGSMGHGRSLTHDTTAGQSQGVQHQGDVPNDGLHINGYPEEPHDFPLQNNRASYLESSNDTAQPPTQTPRISLPESDAASDYADNRKSIDVPNVNVSGVDDAPEHGGTRNSVGFPEEPSQRQTLALDPRRDTRRLTLGLRPLPPEDPSDNPEQRANRIRSFYKEYFDESKPGRETVYYEDYGPEMYDSVMFDDYYNAPPRPFAEPVGRRAMTPPPRAPPRFPGPPRHFPSGSMGGYSGYMSPPGPRAFSSASGRFPGARGPPRRPAPPPEPLQELPTPHMLSNDDAIFQAADFAPPKSFRDQQEGRPGTPLGGLRPFSPMAPVASPLASSFDDLSAMPSPHALRKSGTYTNLDFAPPPRFKNTETASDAASIRSDRTGISYTHMHNIRTGAYRVSRLPANTVGTRDDMMSTLRPTWDMRN